LDIPLVGFQVSPSFSSFSSLFAGKFTRVRWEDPREVFLARECHPYSAFRFG